MLEEIFGQHLKRLRKERKLTQEYVAQAIGVDTRTVRRWEKGEAGPEFNKLEKIAQLLDVPVSKLFAAQKCMCVRKFPETHVKFQESKRRFQESQRKFKSQDDTKT